MRPLLSARRLLLQGLVLPFAFCLICLGGGVSLRGSVPSWDWSSASAKDVEGATCTSMRQAAVLQKSGRFTEARSLLKGCLATDCSNRQRAECAGALQRIKEQSPSLVILASDGSGHDVSDLSVTMDGVLLEEKLDGNAVYVDAGEHEFRFERPGYQPVTRNLTLRRGEKFHLIEMTLQPVAPVIAEVPLSEETQINRWVGVATLGVVGLAGATTFALVGAHARSEERQLDECRQAGGCPQGRIDSVQARYLVANAALGAGVLSLGAALWVLLSDDSTADAISDRGTAAQFGRRTGGWALRPLVGVDTIQLVGQF